MDEEQGLTDQKRGLITDDAADDDASASKRARIDAGDLSEAADEAIPSSTETESAEESAPLSEHGSTSVEGAADDGALDGAGETTDDAAADNSEAAADEDMDATALDASATAAPSGISSTEQAADGPRPKSEPRRWKAPEDQALVSAVMAQGECNWKAIAAKVGTRNHMQCLQRWKKVLKPQIVRSRWSPLEDERLLMAVRNAGSRQNWIGVAESLGASRTARDCRERWEALANERMRAGQAQALAVGQTHGLDLGAVADPVTRMSLGVALDGVPTPGTAALSACDGAVRPGLGLLQAANICAQDGISAMPASTYAAYAPSQPGAPGLERAAGSDHAAFGTGGAGVPYRFATAPSGLGLRAGGADISVEATRLNETHPGIVGAPHAPRLGVQYASSACGDGASAPHAEPTSLVAPTTVMSRTLGTMLPPTLPSDAATPAPSAPMLSMMGPPKHDTSLHGGTGGFVGALGLNEVRGHQQAPLEDQVWMQQQLITKMYEELTTLKAKLRAIEGGAVPDASGPTPFPEVRS